MRALRGIVGELKRVSVGNRGGCRRGTEGQ